MTVTIYRSTDASAPGLSGTVGSLIAVLDAVLVNGYGAQASQGWTKAFSGTNLASYRMPSGTNGCYLDVDDTQAQYTRLRGYATMSAVGVGTEPFPTLLQVAVGANNVLKSSVASSTARPWHCYANGSFIHLFTETDGALIPYLGSLQFGDFTSYVPGDTYNTLLIAGTATTSAAQNAGTNSQLLILSSYYTPSALNGHYMRRSWTGVGQSIPFNKFSNISMMGVNSASGGTAIVLGTYVTTGGTGYANSLLGFPNAGDNGLYADKILLVDATSTPTLRGELPGIWAPTMYMPYTPYTHLDLVPGVGALSARSFQVLEGHMLTPGVWPLMEVSNTW